MKNSMFSGWKDVFLFTLKQGAGQKYRAITIALALILFAGGFAANVFMALSQQKENNISPIETVYVIDESEIADINWTDSKQLDREQFPNVKFEQTKSEIAELGKQLMDNEAASVIAKVTKGKEKDIVNVFVPYGSDVTKDDGENLAKVMDSIVYEGIIKASSIDADNLYAFPDNAHIFIVLSLEPDTNFPSFKRIILKKMKVVFLFLFVITCLV